MTIRQDVRTVRAAKGRPGRMSRSQMVSILNAAEGAVRKYAKRNPAVRAMLSDRGRLARFLGTVARIFGKKTVGVKEIEAAVRILLASGFEVRPPKEARSRRGETRGPTPTSTTPPPVSRTGQRIPMGPRGIRPRGDDIVTAEFADDPVLAEIVGDKKPVDPKEASRTRQAAATIYLTPGSSNVHSHYAIRDGKYVTSYVTFLAWTPGSKTRSGPGSTYAYHDVPVQKWLKFKAAARKSAGGAVWDYYRVKGPGNRARHQHQYTLTRVAPLGVRDLEAYVPRKITRTGYRTRNLPDLSGRSQLRPRGFKVRGNAPKKVVSPLGRTRFI